MENQPDDRSTRQTPPPLPRNEPEGNAGNRLLIILLILLPLIILFLLPGGGIFDSGVWFWMLLFFCIWLLTLVLIPRGKVEAVKPRQLYSDEHPDAVKAVMNVRYAEELQGVRVFRGDLFQTPEATYARLKNADDVGPHPFVQDDEQFDAAIVLLPPRVDKAVTNRESKVWVNWALFAITIGTTTWAGAAHQGVDLVPNPGAFMVGLPYSLGLMAILGLHELGHYLMARHHKMNVTPPYFIPVPFALGTFGAFIKMRSPAENRRALFDVAVAGPLAGLVVAIPALIVGLRSSTIVPGEAELADGLLHHGTSVGSSILFAILAKFSLGDALADSHVLQLSSLAFAGWLGLMVTALNLLPIGQLDGGHIAHAMFGRRRGEIIGKVAMWSLFLLAMFVWPGLLIWAIIVFFIAGRSVPPLEDLTPLTPKRQWLGYFSFLILALILTPLPHKLWEAAGIHCPYM